MAEDVVQLLKDAAQAVDEAGLPDDLREPAFSAVLAHLGLPAGSPTPGSPQSPAGAAGAPLTTQPRPVTTDGIGLIAQKLKLPTEQVGRVFEVDGDTVHLLVSSSSLGGSKKVQQQELTLLTVAARQAAGIDSDLTSIDDVRPVLSDFGVLDRNVSGSIEDLKGSRMRFAGTPRKREFKMNQPGYEAVAELVKRLTE